MAHDTAKKQGDRVEMVVEQYLNGYVDLAATCTAKQIGRVRLSDSFSTSLNECINLSGGQPFFFRQFNLLPSIYGVRWKVDFLLWHPETFPKGLIVEVKQQSVAGSVDEKFPFVVMSLKHAASSMNGVSAVFISGGAVRQCAVEWCLAQETDTFSVLTNEADLRHFIKVGKKKAASTNRNRAQWTETKNSLF